MEYKVELEITDFYSDAIDSVWEWVPKFQEEVYYDLEIEISEIGKPGGTLFYLLVATPEGLFANKRTNLRDDACIIVKDYSWEKLMKILRKIIAECTCDSWDKSLLCLNRKFRWEYRDHGLY